MDVRNLDLIQELSLASILSWDCQCDLIDCFLLLIYIDKSFIFFLFRRNDLALNPNQVDGLDLLPVAHDISDLQ